MGVPLGEVIPEGHPRGSSPLARRIACRLGWGVYVFGVIPAGHPRLRGE